MKIRQAAAFAIDKLSNEVDREFDGARVSLTEERAYVAAIQALAEAFGLPNPVQPVRNCPHCGRQDTLVLNEQGGGGCLVCGYSTKIRE